MREKQVCIVTGASGCIGSNVLKKFYEHDYQVVMVDVSFEKNAKVAKEMNLENIMNVECDITDEEAVVNSVKTIYEKFGRIDTLVNVAGICGTYDKVADLSYDVFKKVYSVNVFGTFLMMKAVIPYMQKQHKGSIINFGSVSGMRGYTYEACYGSSKWAVIGMTKSAANDYGADGIRVNSVSPGWVASPMMEKTLGNYSKLGTEADSINLGMLNRAANPKEIADAVYFLNSDEATYITGVNLSVDGGMLLN